MDRGRGWWYFGRGRGEGEEEERLERRDRTTQEASDTSCTSYEAHTQLRWYLALECTGSEEVRVARWVGGGGRGEG